MLIINYIHPSDMCLNNKEGKEVKLECINTESTEEYSIDFHRGYVYKGVLYDNGTVEVFNKHRLFSYFYDGENWEKSFKVV